MSRSSIIFWAWIFLFTILFSSIGARRSCAQMLEAEQNSDHWPQTVLITNDDGIEDPGLAALAQAFAKFAETYVVAPLQDRSGSAHYVSVYSKHFLKVEERAIGDGIRAYGVDGYPGDCTLLALQGLMRENPPDLVVTGINSGPNLGFDWLASGTIGAARLAAAWGVPAIATSGLDADAPGALAVVPQWVVQLARSEFVRSLDAGQYLTVSFPRSAPEEIKGVRVAERAGILLDFSFSRVEGDSASDNTEIWVLNPPQPVPPVSAKSDAALYSENYVIVVPMRADEHDRELLSRLLEDANALPPWPELRSKK